MSQSADRRALMRDYKDRKVEPGVYAVRCQVTGQAWVGATPDLATRQSGIWFSLRQGGHSCASLRAAWNAHGEEAFVFEVLEAIDDTELGALGKTSLLVERRDHWIVALGAEGLRR
ncbi:MAG: GIY-YIG nuclease family protein [Caulobacter sp.]|nr:GIY-YIG nuclease family protein [Caulobacter sp.]